MTQRVFTVVVEASGSGEERRYAVWLLTGSADAASFTNRRAEAQQIFGPYRNKKAVEMTAESVSRVLIQSGALVERVTLDRS
ncbi:MAG: hypothetical protein ACK4UN_15645 [Limisphaerales bacterium]